MKPIYEFRDTYRQHDPKYENPFPPDHVCLSGSQVRHLNKTLPFYTIYKCIGFEHLQNTPDINSYGVIMNEKDMIDLIFPKDHTWGVYNRYHGIAMTDTEYAKIKRLPRKKRKWFVIKLHTGKVRYSVLARANG